MQKILNYFATFHTRYQQEYNATPVASLSQPLVSHLALAHFSLQTIHIASRVVTVRSLALFHHQIHLNTTVTNIHRELHFYRGSALTNLKCTRNVM